MATGALLNRAVDFGAVKRGAAASAPRGARMATAVSAGRSRRQVVSAARSESDGGGGARRLLDPPLNRSSPEFGCRA